MYIITSVLVFIFGGNIISSHCRRHGYPLIANKRTSSGEKKCNITLHYTFYTSCILYSLDDLMGYYFTIDVTTGFQVWNIRWSLLDVPTSITLFELNKLTGLHVCAHILPRVFLYCGHIARFVYDKVTFYYKFERYDRFLICTSVENPRVNYVKL